MRRSRHDAPIPVRRVSFDFSYTPRYWNAGEPAITAFAYALSAVFPEGERFFIDAVRNFRDRIDSPALARQVNAFVGQEAQHGRVHEAYNAHAESHGFAVGDVAAVAAQRLELARAQLSEENQLALTCALEHFTAMMAGQLLADPRYTQNLPDAHATLWRWHAAEEAEHKSVAFDVYQAVDGNYVRRVVVYSCATFSFALGTGLSTVHLMAKDGRRFDVRSYVALARFLFSEPGLIRNMAPQWLGYFRSDFHPADRDDAPLIARWKREWAPPSAQVLG
jgi:predicted metal-dependent hydrolase